MELTRKQLVELLTISDCSEWTTPIKKYLDRLCYGSESSTTEISKEDISKMYDKGTQTQIQAAEKFGVKRELNDIYSIVDFNSALKYAGKMSSDVVPYFTPTNKQQSKLNSQAILWFVIDLFNKSTGKEVDWENNNQYKYEPYWYIKDGFRLYRLGAIISYDCVGSQEVFLDKKHGEHVTKYFFEDYKNVKL